MDNQNEKELEFDVIENGGIVQPKAFRYIITLPNGEKHIVTVISTSHTDAKEGLKNNVPEGTGIMYDGVSTHIMQF